MAVKTILGIFGVLLTLTGVIWFFQGIGVIPGSFMTGEDFWAVAGFLAVITGIVLIRSWRRKQPTPAETNTERDQPQQKD